MDYFQIVILREHALAHAVEAEYCDIRARYGAVLSGLWYWFCAIDILFHYLNFSLKIALPAAYTIFNRWLSGFAYRTGFSVWFLLIPSLFTLGLAALTVSYHTLRAATSNPVDALRYE